MLKPIALATLISGTLDILLAMILTVLYGREIGNIELRQANVPKPLIRARRADIARYRRMRQRGRQALCG